MAGQHIHFVPFRVKSIPDSIPVMDDHGIVTCYVLKTGSQLIPLTSGSENDTIGLI